MLTGHLGRAPNTKFNLQQQRKLQEQRQSRGLLNGCGRRPPTWSEGDKGSPPPPPSPCVAPQRAGKVKSRLVRLSQARGANVVGAAGAAVASGYTY